MWLAAPSTSALSGSCLLQTNPLATPWHLLVPSWRSQLPSCSQPLAPAFSPSVSPQLQVDLAGGRSGNWHGVRIDLRVLLYLPAIGCGNQREKVSEPWRELVVLLTSKSWTPPAARRPPSSSSPLSESPQDTGPLPGQAVLISGQADLDLQLRSVWASTSRDRPRRSSRPARHRAGRTGAGAGHGATHGGAPVAPDLRVSRGERRRQVEFRVPIDVGAGRPWLGGLRRWLPGFVAVGLPAARHPPPGPGFSPIE